MASDSEQAPPAELSLAGSVVDKAIGYLIEQKVPPVAIASALLGGSMALLAQTLGDEAICGILNNAMVRVSAASINPSDIRIVEGAFHSPLPRIPGRDYAGTVVAGDAAAGLDVWG